MNALKICLVCFTHFIDPKHPNKKMCSRKCAGLYKRTIDYKNCPKCNKEFRSPRKFCSFDCARSSFGHKKGKTLTRFKTNCLICNKEFFTVPSSSQKFCCSAKCSAIRRTKTPFVKTCKYCSKLFNTKILKAKYCSKRCSSKDRVCCRSLIKKTIKNRKTLRSEKGNICNRCGWKVEPEILELHHIDINTKNNSIQNLELLCPNCHSLDHYLSKDGQFSSLKKSSPP